MLYLAGPYSGNEPVNLMRHWHKAQSLWSKGHIVISPICNTALMSGADFIAGDLEIIGRLKSGDGIYMMRGWESSMGAQMELHQAKEQGLNVYIEGVNEPCDVTQSS